jgi:ribosomal protein S7
MPMVDLSLLIKSIEEAKSFAESDNRAIIGIADHVPVDVEFSRLKEIFNRINGG